MAWSLANTFVGTRLASLESTNDDTYRKDFWQPRAKNVNNHISFWSGRYAVKKRSKWSEVITTHPPSLEYKPNLYQRRGRTAHFNRKHSIQRPQALFEKDQQIENLPN